MHVKDKSSTGSDKKVSL